MKLFFFIFIISCFAQIQFDNCGTNIKCVYDNSQGTQELKITLNAGAESGKMNDYPQYNPPWNDYVSEIASVSIDQKITHIGAYSFYGAYSLLTITIPKDVKTIGKQAFPDCSSVTTLTFEEGSVLEEIGEHAFERIGIESVVLPNTLKIIGKYAFSESVDLKSVTFGKSVEKIDDYAFSNTLMTH